MGQTERNGGRPVAIVTGASYGIGAACAQVLARDGFDIVATEIDPGELANVAAAVDDHGAGFEAVALDLRDRTAIDHAVARAAARFGRLDVLVNNAGVPLSKPALDVGYEEFMDVMAINVAGSYFMAQRTARHFIDAGTPGSIVNLASTFAAIGVPGVSVYGVSKAAIAGLTRHLAVEWVRHGIRVNAVAPGAVETRLRMKAFNADPAFRDAYMDKVPMKRFGEPSDVAEAVAYLAGGKSGYVTGQVMYVDGGLTVS